MKDALGPGTRLGYCTNVHEGPTWTETLANLARHGAGVRRHIEASDGLAIGIWLSASAARDGARRARELTETLGSSGLIAYTINGFPYGDFHGRRVKHDVYRPNWTEEAREVYTRELVAVLAALLPEGEEGSISTLPVGWRGDVTPAGLEMASRRLVAMAAHLALVEAETGRTIHLDLEPEPGCVLDTVRDVVTFFHEYLFRVGDERTVRRYIRVCHDVCHAAVMFEPQAEVIEHLARAGIVVGKVQISSAIRATLDEEGLVVAALSDFAEDRYLHQTMIEAQGRREFFDDLPLATGPMTSMESGSEVRVHFHVPVFASTLGILGTTQSEIADAIETALVHHGTRHFEVETYAWNVLPEAYRAADLDSAIAAEMTWVRDAIGPA